ncbi:hypothetical protein NC651_015258 [Populus alba x Populus x berolinensis]|nr:hypothetical protein NC651_015258 [Populus alba x Populus x berolinensis]
MSFSPGSALNCLWCSMHGYVGHWTLKLPVFDLTAIFFLPKRSNASETVELLVHKTPAAEEEIYRHAKAGKSICVLSNVSETVELLVHKTPEFEEEIYRYAKTGKVFELAADGGSMILREFITSEITLLIARKMRAEQNANHPLARTCKDKHMAMVPSLLSIEASERTGEELAAYGSI